MTRVDPAAITVALWVKCVRARALQTVFSIFSKKGREVQRLY
jgi:hypothetical protein